MSAACARCSAQARCLLHAELIHTDTDMQACTGSASGGQNTGVGCEAAHIRLSYLHDPNTKHDRVRGVGTHCMQMDSSL